MKRVTAQDLIRDPDTRKALRILTGRLKLRPTETKIPANLITQVDAVLQNMETVGWITRSSDGHTRFITLTPLGKDYYERHGRS